jgi:hypothetical protein
VKKYIYKGTHKGKTFPQRKWQRRVCSKWKYKGFLKNLGKFPKIPRGFCRNLSGFFTRDHGWLSWRRGGWGGGGVGQQNIFFWEARNPAEIWDKFKFWQESGLKLVRTDTSP